MLMGREDGYVCVWRVPSSVWRRRTHTISPTVRTQVQK